MATSGEDFSIGVEEEFQIVDATTRALRPRAGRLLRHAQAALGDHVTNELYLSQIEIGTGVCGTLAEVRSELMRHRRTVIEAARREGSRIAAAGTHPFSHWEDQSLTPKPRYFELAADFRQVTREQIIFGSLEFRVADVCMTVDETVMVAGLVRALARACHADWSAGRPVAPVRPELLRAAKWQASRFGLEGALIDVQARQAVPAPDLVESLLRFVRPWLEEAGDWDEVCTLVRETLKRGNGARRQREVLQRTGRMEDVVDLIVSETERGLD